jgi:hypothetical protein
MHGARAGAEVVDGDGIRLGGERIRLWGEMHPNSIRSASEMPCSTLVVLPHGKP